MTKSKQTQISRAADNRKLLVVREFDAPLEQVWNAWTNADLLDQWWAPRPWRAETKTMDFREGGQWLYCMVGPDGSRQWCRVNYESIIAQKSILSIDSFCDENGNPTHLLPDMHWKNKFSSTGTGTKVEIEITFSSEADLQKIMELGFEEGFTSALTNLDELVEN